MKKDRFAPVWNFVWPILILIAAAALAAGATFLISKWGDFSIRSFSDRLFWAGIVLIVIGGGSALGTVGSLSTVGTPSIMTAGADARNAQSRIQDHFKVNARRYKSMMTFFLAGIACIAISALTEILTR